MPRNKVQQRSWTYVQDTPKVRSELCSQLTTEIEDMPLFGVQSSSLKMMEWSAYPNEFKSAHVLWPNKREF